MPRSTTLLTVILLVLFAQIAYSAEGLATPRSNTSSGSLPVTYALRRQYQVANPNPARATWGTESKYKDAAGRTVSTANTVGNLTTHKDPAGRVIGYTIAANGKSLHYDAHGRAIKQVQQ